MRGVETVIAYVRATCTARNCRPQPSEDRMNSTTRAHARQRVAGTHGPSPTSASTSEQTWGDDFDARRSRAVPLFPRAREEYRATRPLRQNVL